MLDQKVSGEFKRGDGLLACHRWEVVEESFQAVARREVVEQVLHGHPSSHEYGGTAHDLWVDPDDRFKGGHPRVPASDAMVAEFGLPNIALHPTSGAITGRGQNDHRCCSNRRRRIIGRRAHTGTAGHRSRVSARRWADSGP